ncbi:hypothetical protein JCM24511_09005 [Saitozyma sp. JCM 24511]|nr:hypothetical protein JCM24511_09005 [Saitozyma sp. JCM 24511]
MSKAEEIAALAADPLRLSQAYGKSGIVSFVKSPIVVLASLAAAIGGFVYGFDQGLINVTLSMPEFLLQFPLIDASVTPRAAFYRGLVTAIFELGAVLGALQSAVLAEKLSRRRTIFVATFWYLLGSVLQAASQNFTMMCFGRFIGGMGVGIASMIAPLYISEVAPPHLRGALFTLQQWMLIFGILVAFWVTYGSQNISGQWSWRLAFTVQIFPGILFGLVVLFMPFSPRWLGSVDRDDDCLKTLSKLRQLPVEDVRVQSEWLEIRTEALLQRELRNGLHPNLQDGSWQSALKLEFLGWSDCFRKEYIKRIHVGMGINAFQQWVGVNGFTYFSTVLFAQLGYDENMRLILSGLLTVVQLVGTTVPIFCLDNIGRRPLLLFGSFMLFSCLIINAIVIAKYNDNWGEHLPAAKAGTAFFFMFMFFFEISWGPIAWGIPSEIMPSAIRTKGVALSSASNWFSNFIVGLVVPPLVAAVSYGSFALFSGTSFLAIVWVYCFVPETTNKTLEQLAGAFGDEITVAESARKEQILLDLLAGRTTLEGHEKVKIPEADVTVITAIA